MKNYKKSAIFICVILFFSTSIYAESFDNRESEMNEKCATIYDETTRQECSAYKAYLENKKAEIDLSIDDLNQQISAVKGDIDKITALIYANQEEINKIELEIQETDDLLKKLESSIDVLQANISEKQKDIKKRDEYLKKRMIETQPSVSCNFMIDFIMGASDFTDIIRRVAIVNELAKYDQEQMNTLKIEKSSLETQQNDLEIKHEILQIKLDEQSAKKNQVDLMKQSNEKLVASYREKEASLQEAKVKAQVSSGIYSSTIPNIDLSILPPAWNDSDSPSSENPPQNQPSLSTGFIQPIRGEYYQSAGTWYYPLEFSGGIPLEHLGMDFGTYQKTGLPVVAPASGVIVAISDGVANHPIGSSGLNSWTGYPAGGGNTLHMITSVNGICYGISFYHLSPGMFTVRVGDVVTQGQVIAHTGHSGNTSGPHCHVEVTRLGAITVQQGVQTFYNYGKDYFYGNYTVSGSCELKGTTPCLEKPEHFFR